MEFFVGRLPDNTSSDEFEAYFSQFGEVVKSNIHSTKNFGFVTFKDKYELKTSDVHKIRGEIIYIRPSKKESKIHALQLSAAEPSSDFTKFRVHVNQHMAKKQLIDYFKQFGNAVDYSFKKSPDSKSHRPYTFGFVVYKGDHFCIPSKEDHEIDGVKISVKKEIQNERDGQKFHVSDLPIGTQKSDLKAYFEQFGTAQHVHLDSAIRFGFVVFEGENSCVPSDAHTIRGSVVTVSVPRPGNHTLDSLSSKKEFQSGRDAPDDGQKFHVSSLPKGTMKSEFDAYFAQLGTLKHTFVDSAKCYGFVTFDGEHSCVPSSDTHKIRGSLVTVSVLKNTHHALPAGCTRFKLIFVNGETVTKEQLDNYCRNFGELTDSLVFAGRHGNYAFVTFKGKHSFCANGTHVIEGKTVSVGQVAKSKDAVIDESLKSEESKVEPVLNESLKRKAVEPEVVAESLNSNNAVVDESLKSKDAVEDANMKSKKHKKQKKGKK